MAALDDIRAHIDGEWRTAREIHRRIDCWSQIRIRSTLNELAKAGEIKRQQEKTPTGFQWIYRKSMS